MRVVEVELGPFGSSLIDHRSQWVDLSVVPSNDLGQGVLAGFRQPLRNIANVGKYVCKVCLVPILDVASSLVNSISSEPSHQAEDDAERNGQATALF